MKTVLVALCLVALLATLAMAAPPQGALYKGASPRSIDNEQYINANNILMFVTNHGNFGRDLAGVFGNDYGTYFPYSTNAEIEDGSLDNSVVYASGLWMGARDSVTGETRVIISEYEDEYVPGPMAGGTFQTDRPEFKVYKLYKDSLPPNANDDYLNWPTDQGAPVDTAGNPLLIGDQMLWSVYNDADPDQHGNDAGKTLPLGIEVRHTTFAFNRTDPLGNIIFFRLQIYNEGGNTLEECYFSLWCDPDLGQFTDDLVGCDTNLSVGFCYNGDNDDNQFGSSPPCVGYDFFQGPLIFTGVDTDTARMWDTVFPGYVNLGMASFNKYINGTDPDNYQETYNYMRGLNRDGTQYTYGGVPTKFFVSGDPVSGAGDLDFAPADRRFLITTGPVTFRPGDSTEIVAAIIVGQGLDRKSSISFMRFNDQFAQDAYENSFVVPQPPAAPRVSVAVNDGQVSLSWTDTSEVDNGTYPFEGYTVWQGESPIGPWTQIVNLDAANAVEDIFDQVPDPLTGAIEIRLVKNGSNQGIAHDIVIEEDYINGGPLYNLSTYFFKVDAYSYNPDAAVAKTLTSEDIVRATPQSPIAGTSYDLDFGDMVDVGHVGGSDGQVRGYVVNSTIFDGSSYEVHFYDTAAIHVDTFIDEFGDPYEVYYNYAWHLINTTSGDTLIAWQWIQEPDTIWEAIDGLMLYVAGPPLEGKDYDYVSADPENWSPVAVAEWTDGEGNPYEGGRWFTGIAAGGEIFFGGVFLAPTWGEGTTLTGADYKPVELHFRPMISYTDLTGDDLYDIGEPYVVEAGPDDSRAFFYQNRNVGSTYRGFLEIPFTAWDVSDPDNPRQLNVVIRDYDDNGQWEINYLATDDDTLTLPNGGDIQYNYIFILDSDYDPTGTMFDDGSSGIDWTVDRDGTMWVLWLDDRGNGGMLAEEGIFTLIPNYPNLPSDTFSFTLSAPMTATGESELDRINVVPNPFYLYSTYDPAPGNYQIKFQHLPGTCTIKIFNLSGDLVRIVEKTDVSISYANWDAKTENGLPVASGIYIYVVEAPGFGTKIGKMAVFTEVEVLDTY